MIRQYSKILGTPVLSHDEGDPLATVEDVVIHPDTGKIEALWVRPLTLPFRHGILTGESIISWKKNIYVKDEQSIAEPEEVVRIADILARKTYFIGNRVKGESGRRYGKVFDFDFDDRKMYLRYLFVHQSLLVFDYGHRFFHYDSIVQALPEAIIVKEDEGKTAKERSLAEDPRAVLDA
jgi:sporulation protein YlmC with PRC-barrel domain